MSLSKLGFYKSTIILKSSSVRFQMCRIAMNGDRCASLYTASHPTQQFTFWEHFILLAVCHHCKTWIYSGASLYRSSFFAVSLFQIFSLCNFACCFFFYNSTPCSASWLAVDVVNQPPPCHVSCTDMCSSPYLHKYLIAKRNLFLFHNTRLIIFLYRFELWEFE